MEKFLSEMMFVECLQKMSKISRILLLLLVLSNMHFLLFNASGETVAGGREREGKCKFIYIGTIHLFPKQQYFLINIQKIEFKITACLPEYIVLHEIIKIKLKNFVNIINGKTVTQCQTNFDNVMIKFDENANSDSRGFCKRMTKNSQNHRKTRRSFPWLEVSLRYF